MRKAFVFLICNLLLSNQLAIGQQLAEKDVAGEFMLSGVMETAAGFLLKPDHTFQYGFTYGAADKNGKGTWKLTGNKLVLNSPHAQPTSDFVLKYSKASGNNEIVVLIKDEAGNFYPYVKCRLASDPATEITTNNKGEASFKSIGNGVLELYHPVFSTRISQIKLDKKHNRFIVYPAYSLAEVFFKNFTLQIEKDHLKSSELPGMPLQDAAAQHKQYIFIRSE